MAPVRLAEGCRRLRETGLGPDLDFPMEIIKEIIVWGLSKLLVNAVELHAQTLLFISFLCFSKKN